MDDIDPCAPVTVTAADGSRLTVAAHGGHVLGWTPAGGPAGRLWLSPTAVCGPGTAFRGGIPVIFPQFADRGPLPKHGVARNRPWRLATGPDGADAATATATLTADDATLAVWPHRFTLVLDARAAGGSLTVRLTVTNDDDAPWSFTAALHGYLAVGDPDGARLHGLAGLTAEDNAAGGARLTVPDEPLATAQTRDVAVRAVPGPVRLADPGLGDLTLSAEDLPDRVVWNPGPGHGLGDVPEGAERGFVCIEPAVLDAVTLAPGESWTGTERLTV